MRNKKRVIILATFLCGLSFALHSQEKRPGLVSLALGSYGFDRDHPRMSFQIEYKAALNYYGLRPQVGAMTTVKQAFYFYGGAAYDLYLGKYFVITPSFCPGIYFRGNDKDLHYPIEFRSCLEVAGVFKNQARLGLEVYHMSNASLAHKNPGRNSLAVFFSIPLKTD